MSCKRVNGEGTSPLLEASADPCGHLCLLEETNGNQIDDFFTVLLDRIDRTDLSEGNIETPAGNLEDEFYSFQVVRVKPVGDCHETGMEIIESS